MQPYDIDPRLYSIQGELGRGTSGVVLKALDVRLDRPVALKVPQFRNDQNRTAQSNQFFCECRVLAWLTANPEPNIPRLHAVESDFAVREFIDGETLEQRTTAASVSLREAVAYLATVCRTVSRVHAIGIAHRNLHAANILIAQDGTPMLIGFGRCGPLSTSAANNTARSGTPAGVDVRGMQGVLNWVCTILEQPVPAAVDAAQQPGAAASANKLADLLAQCAQDCDAG